MLKPTVSLDCDYIRTEMNSVEQTIKFREYFDRQIDFIFTTHFIPHSKKIHLRDNAVHANHIFL